MLWLSFQNLFHGTKYDFFAFNFISSFSSSFQTEKKDRKCTPVSSSSIIEKPSAMASILLGPLCWLESIEDGGKEKGLVLKPKAWLSVTIFPKKSGIIPTLLCQLINNPDPMAYSLEKPGDGVPYANQDGGETFVVAFPFPLKNQEGNTRAYSHYLGFKTQAGQVCRVGSFIVEGGGEIVDFQGTFLPLRMNVEGKSGMKRMAPCSLHVENPPSKRLRTGLAQDLVLCFFFFFFFFFFFLIIFLFLSQVSSQ